MLPVLDSTLGVTSRRIYSSAILAFGCSVTAGVRQQIPWLINFSMGMRMHDRSRVHAVSDCMSCASLQETIWSANLSHQDGHLELLEDR